MGCLAVSPRAVLALSGAMLLAAGCQGQFQESLGECSESAAPARIRRLTRTQYDNSASQLLGVLSEKGQGFPVEDEVMGYTNHDMLQVSPLLAEKLDTAAKALVSSAAAQLDAMAPCPAGASTEMEVECARKFITSFAKVAFRRPAEAEEIADLLDLYRLGREGEDYRTGIQLVAQGVLQSAAFLYRTELGTPGDEGSERIALTPHEVASEISYLLTNGPPDAELTRAADENRLSPDEIERQVRRLLQDPAARQTVRQFFIQWLGLQNAGFIQKNTQSFPEFREDLRNAMRLETETFIDYVLFESDHRLTTLFSADYSFANAQLAAFYGLPAPPPDPAGFGTGMSRIALTNRERRGILTHASLLATYAHRDDSSPVKRGKFVRIRLLCQEVEPPPPGVQVNPPPLNPSMTTRERVQAHTSDPFCMGCHQKIDPIGFGMEDFDGIGKHRTTEAGRPVDASGTLAFVSDQGGDFTGAVALAEKLAVSRDVQACFNIQLFRFAMGRKEQSDDRCALDAVQQRFRRSGTDVWEAVVELARSPSFTQRTASN